MTANTIDIFDVVQEAIAANYDAGSYYIANATLEAIRSAGYVVVPVDPTDAMDDAGSRPYSDDEGHIAVYAAMIAAATR